MDTQTVEKWRQAVKRILKELVDIPYPDEANVTSKTVFDEAADVYLVVVEGWRDVRRMHGCLVHVEIREDKIWILLDGTENGVAEELMAAGVPKEHIVLGFKSPQARLHTGFAVA